MPVRRSRWVAGGWVGVRVCEGFSRHTGSLLGVLSQGQHGAPNGRDLERVLTYSWSAIFAVVEVRVVDFEGGAKVDVAVEVVSAAARFAQIVVREPKRAPRPAPNCSPSALTAIDKPGCHERGKEIPYHMREKRRLSSMVTGILNPYAAHFA